MELRHLRYFVAAAREEHFGRAAAALNIAQPALSKQIADLEYEIGTTLFDRLPRGVRLNKAGARLLEDATRILAEAEEAKARARAVGMGEEGQVTIGVIENASWTGIVPDSFHTFRRLYARNRLVLSLMASVEQAEEIAAGRLDGGFLYYRPDRETLQGLRVATHRLILAVPRRHRLGQRSVVTTSDLRGEDFVWIPRASAPQHFDAVLTAAHGAGLEMSVVQEAPNESAMLSLVAGGMGVAFVNEEVRHRRPGDVILVPVEDFDVSIDLEFTYRGDNSNPALKKFRDVVLSLRGRD